MPPERKKPNPVDGRVIVEVTRRHVLMYRCSADGVVQDQDVFAFPRPLETQADAEAEIEACYGFIYDRCNSVINSSAGGNL